MLSRHKVPDIMFNKEEGKMHKDIANLIGWMVLWVSIVGWVFLLSPGFTIADAIIWGACMITGALLVSKGGEYGEKGLR